ncbi:MAG: hypothetical protein KGK30_05735, partial [Elusimicrobia bacterium]|nr:hypothetical protein [Elusimicrobiota bacterium]
QGRPVSKRVDWFEMAAEKKVGLPDGAEVRAVRWAAAASARRLLRYPTDLRVLLKWSESARRRG